MSLYDYIALQRKYVQVLEERRAAPLTSHENFVKARTTTLQVTCMPSSEVVRSICT